jgi:hypothetical protein
MGKFDLDRFRDLAFGRRALPDHPLQNLAEAEKLIALLPPDDPDHGLAELTHWASTMNATESFTPGRRARLLIALDGASRPFWREQASRYLSAAGRPREGRDGDAGLLRAMFDCVSEVSNGFAMALDAESGDSKWLDKQRAWVSLRNMRALTRRLALAHMLRHAAASAIWERLHRRYLIAEELGLARTLLPVFEGDTAKSSVRQEYAHALLFELAAPDSLRGRDAELLFRISRRMASAVQLESQPFGDAWFAVVPAGDTRPQPLARLGAGSVRPPIYIGTANCLPRLRAALERDAGTDSGETDRLFGGDFTLRERNALLNRLLEYWGPHPPQRRARRVAIATPVRIISGFDKILRVVPPLAKAKPEDEAAARRRLSLQLDATTNALKRSSLRAARENPARLVDASAGGMGIAIRRADAGWAALGCLVAVLIEPGKTWAIGVLRRIFSVDDELRLGIQTLSARPAAVTLRTDTLARDHVWEDAMKHEASYNEHFQTGLLLAPQSLPLPAGEILLAPALASRGTQFGVPLPQGEQRIRVTRLLDAGEHYQRAMFESLGVGK